MSILRILVISSALTGLVAATGCTEKVHANVNCNVSPDESIKCTVTQDVGKAEIDVCWDLSITCGNGAVVTTPHSCATVADGKTSELVIAKDKLANLDKCAGDAPKMALSNLTINGGSQ